MVAGCWRRGEEERGEVVWGGGELAVFFLFFLLFPAVSLFFSFPFLTVSRSWDKQARQTKTERPVMTEGPKSQICRQPTGSGLPTGAGLPARLSVGTEES